MKIIYTISSKKNPLYDGKYFYEGMYKTYGQHSFIYDFALGCLNKKIALEIYIDDIDTFPLSHIFSNLGIQINLMKPKLSLTADIIILDNHSKSFYNGIKFNGFVIGIIHNSRYKQPDEFYYFTNKIICLTEISKERQEGYATKEKIVLINQSIDTKRFTPKMTSIEKKEKNLLLYSRMDEDKGRVFFEIIDIAIKDEWNITLLGDGKYFWKACNVFSSSILPINYIPCYSIQKFINNFSLIVSNGRGVMEGLSCNIPVIAAGQNYCGLITVENIHRFLRSNFTGSDLLNFEYNILSDIKAGFTSEKNYRSLAIEYFSVDDFLNKLIQLTLS